MSASLHLGPLDLAGLVAQAQAEDAPRQTDTGGILDFFDIPSGDAFDVPPAKAIAFFSAKGLKPSFHYADMLAQEHVNAFTVAKMMDVDLLGQVRASLDAALASGQSFRDWSHTITPLLQAGGWWGKSDLTDPLTGKPITAQLGSPWRLETIFRTNMQSAYAAGAWQEIEAQAHVAPFLMYDAVDDFRTRPLHAKWDRTVLPVTSDWWRTHYPPNGYNCRCSVIQLDKEQVKQLGLQVASTAPQDGNYEWTNPRTGATGAVPMGIDPGFGMNVGQLHQAHLKRLLAEKAAALPADMHPAAAAATKALPALDDATIAAIKADNDAASQQARENLAALKARAADAADQADAMGQLDAIKGGKDTAGKGAAYKIKALAQLQKDPAWAAAKPTEQIEQVLKLADDFKYKTELASKLSVYKAAVLEGKIPPPATVKAFQGLSPEEQDAFLAKVGAEVQAAKAAKQAAETAKAAAAKAAADAAAKAAADEAAAQAEKAAAAAKSAQDAATAKAAQKAAAKAQQAAAKAAAAAPTPKPPATGTPPNASALTKVGEQKGSNPGGTYLDTSTGKQWYIKQPPAGYEVAANEVLAGKLYQLAGIDVPEMHVLMIDGKPSIASQIIDGLAPGGVSALATASGTAEGFAADAWLANWDVVGLSYDNLLLKGARTFRVDTGGALRFRAQGGMKGAAFGDTVTEFATLRDAGLNRTAAGVFGRLTEQQIEDSAVRVLKISEADIRDAVSQAGPTDATTREALVQRLLARQRDIADKYPGAAVRARGEAVAAATEPTGTLPRVTAAEQALIADSRVNGYGFTTDTDQIEDHMVVVHNYRRQDGSDATRGFLKLTEGGSSTLAAKIKAATNEPPELRLAEANAALLAAVKNINVRASSKMALDATTVKRIEAAVVAADKALAEINAAMMAVGKAPADMKAAHKAIEKWRDIVAGHLNSAKAGEVVGQITSKYPSTSIPDTLTYTPRNTKTAATEGGIKWQRKEGTYAYQAARFDRSRSVESDRVVEVGGTRVRYEAQLEDGTRLVYFPHDPKNAWAMQGVVQIDTPGATADSATRVFNTLSEAGINGERADEVARQHLYLNSVANIRLLRNPPAMAQYKAAAGVGPEGVAQKLAILKRETGIDVQGSEGWKTVDGVREAFGHGRAYQHRPDLSAQDLAALNKTHVLYHNPQGLGANAGDDVFERLKMVIDGGGSFASLTDRVRRGVPLSGSSVSSDLASGGGDYHFTRLRPRALQEGTGVYWTTSVLRRMDAISYNSDQFGRTTAWHVEANRLGQTVGSLKTLSNAGSNETIFKAGLSIFEGLDRIVLASSAEVRDAIFWMKTRGYKEWPDGRRLEDVIVTNGK